MSTSEAIERMHVAGFLLAANGESLSVSPAENLSDRQRQWLRAHKAEILDELRAMRSADAVLDADGGHDLAPANDLHHLPPRLVSAAIRVCRELHGDDEGQIQRMLDDLAAYPESDWGALTEHFESQLPPPPEPGMERIPMQTAGHAFEMDVPAGHATAAREALRFQLKNGHGGSLLGSPGTTAEELRGILLARYGSRLAAINDQPLP